MYSRHDVRLFLQTLFIGIGADEQMGGYARHRTKFRLLFYPLRHYCNLFKARACMSIPSVDHFGTHQLLIMLEMFANFVTVNAMIA